LKLGSGLFNISFIVERKSISIFFQPLGKVEPNLFTKNLFLGTKPFPIIFHEGLHQKEKKIKFRFKLKSHLARYLFAFSCKGRIKNKKKIKPS